MPVKGLPRHLEEEGRHHGLVADVHPGAGYADGVHPGQVGSGRLQRAEDALIMVGGVGVHLGVPDHFLGKQGLPVHHRADLAVRAARVKTDAAAIQVPADAAGLLPGSADLSRAGGL